MKKNLGMLALIMAFWFTISFITNILGPLIPDIIHNFNLSDLAMAGFIPTSFFLAYAIMSTDPHGQDGIAQSPSPADHQEARSSAMNSFSCSNSSLATSGCLAETLLSWNGSSLRQYSSSRAGTSLEAAAVQVH